MDWIRRNLKIIVPAGVVALAGLAYLAFGVFGVQFLFIDDTVDEAGPVFDSGISASAESEDGAGAAPATTLPPATTPASGEAADDGAATAPASTTPPTPETTAPPAPQIVTLAAGEFISRDHPGEGQAIVLNDGSAQRFLRFENFATDNGPDLNVYLTSSDADGPEGAFDDDFVDLGDLKGNIGDQNYEIPPDVDLAVYDTVVVWCVRFSSAFTAADLVPSA